MRLGIADLSDHGRVIATSENIWLGQGPILTGMEHHAQHAGAVHMATRLVQEVVGCDNRHWLLELLLGGFHIVVAACSYKPHSGKQGT